MTDEKSAGPGRDRSASSRPRRRTLRDRPLNRDSLYDAAPAGAGSILKALHILEEIVDGPRAISVAELSSILKYSKPTTHRIATFLEEFGYLEREPGGRRFIESQRFIDLALKILLAAAQRPNRRGVLNWVVEQTGETCNFGVLHRGELVYLDRVQAEWPLGLRFEPGSRVPLHCTAIGVRHQRRACIADRRCCRHLWPAAGDGFRSAWHSGTGDLIERASRSKEV